MQPELTHVVGNLVHEVAYVVGFLPEHSRHERSIVVARAQIARAAQRAHDLRSDHALAGVRGLAPERLPVHVELDDLEDEQRDETLVTTQRLVEEMKLAAKREADLIVREAELRGDKAVEAARSEEAKLRVEIQALRRLRRQAAEEVASTLDRYQRLLHAEAEDDPGEPS